MSSTAGLPQTPVQRPPLRRGVKEGLIALAALPVLLAAGVYVGGQLGASGATAQPVAVAGTSATPLVAPAPVVTVQPAAPRPVVTVKPAAPGPVVTVKPAAPGPVVTVKPAAPRPVVTVKPAAPAAPRPAAVMPFPPAGPSLAGPVAPTAPPAGPRVVLGLGSSGLDVLTWQRQMLRRHWRIRADGVFGPESERVALEFQRIKGLRVDGLVGPETWAATWRRPVIL